MNVRWGRPEMPGSMRTKAIKNFLLSAIVIVIVLLAGTVIFSRYSQTHGKSPGSDQAGRLAEDADLVVKGYKFQELKDGFQLDISGSRVVHRGRTLLGLRSNVVKATFFDNVHGKFKTPQGTLLFSAVDAEWSADMSHPFIMKKGVLLTVNGKQLHDVKRAKIFFKQRVLEVEGNGMDKKYFKL